MSAWRSLDGRPTAWFVTSSHAQGAALVSALTDRLDATTPLPDVDLRRGGVRVTTGDVRTADLVGALADELGLAPDTAALQRLSVVVEARDVTAVTDFWRTVTGYDAGAEGAVDPLRRDPAIRVVAGDGDRPLRVRLHLDVSRPHELGREAARTVAPDRVPTGDDWPFFVNVADPDGNEADLVPVVPADRFEDAPGTDDWRIVFGAKALWTGERAAVVGLVARAAALADDAGLPLMIDVRDDAVVVDSGKDLWEATGFVALAAAVQAAARDLGLAAEPDRLRFLQVGFDAVDVPAVREFWRSVLGYEHDPREFLTDVVDPDLLDVPLMFQPMSADDTARREQRGRVQLRLDVAPEHVGERLDAARAAGGTVLSSDDGAGRWVVADAEGNELHLHAG